jgi:hypothetical protein
VQVCAAVDPELELMWTQKDGDFVVKGTIFGSVHGAARSILVAERVALNFLQRMSGIATAAHTMVAAVEVRMHLVFPQGALLYICSLLGASLKVGNYEAHGLEWQGTHELMIRLSSVALVYVWRSIQWGLSSRCCVQQHRSTMCTLQPLFTGDSHECQILRFRM